MFRFLSSLAFVCCCVSGSARGHEHVQNFMEKQTHDVLMVTGQWSCSSDLALKALFQYMKVPIGLVYVIGPPSVIDACKLLTESKVICVPEEHILPQSVVPSVNAANFTFQQSRSGWYYQQVVKLLAVHALPLRPHYLIWDADNILIRDYSPYLDGAMRLLTASFPDSEHYDASLMELLHVKKEGRNLVVHQICVVKTVMMSLLRFICGDKKGEQCAAIILSHIPRRAHARYALSEYSMYSVWQKRVYEGAYIETDESFLRSKKQSRSVAMSHCAAELAALTKEAQDSKVAIYSVILEVTHLKATQGGVVKHVAKEFEKIYSTNYWNDGESKSGHGSTLQITQSARSCIGEWILKYKFQKFGDICGDANWQKHIPNIDKVEYTGFDVSEVALKGARENNPSFSFQQWDLSKNPPPHGFDVFMIRDVVQHLPAYFGLSLYRNLILSGVRYLITSHYPKGKNRNIEIGQYYTNSIFDAPFDLLNFSPPLEVCANYDDNDRRGSRLVLVELPFFFKPKLDSEVCAKVHTFVEKSVKKSICLDKITPGSCVVYSFGINYQWEFDDFMHNYGCTVHSFDPGMNYQDKRAENHFFHKIGLGNYSGVHVGPSTLYNKKIEYSVETVQTLMKKLGHDFVDLIRLDVEGAEWDVLDFLPYHQLGQLSIEVHMWHESYEFYLSKVENIPMQSWATYQNVDRINKMTMTEVIPGVTRVYELAFM